MIVDDIDISDYHRSPRVSAHKLKTLQSKGPRGYYMAHVQGSWREADKDAYVVGRALEDRLQRPTFFDAHYAHKPEGMNFSTKEGKAWKAERLAEKKEILDADDVATIATLVETLDQSPKAQALIAAAQAQLSIVHKETPWASLPGLQARPDWLCLKGCAESEWRPFSLDLKSTLTLPELSSGRSILKYGYHRQAACVELCLQLEGVDVSGFRHLLLAAEKAFPHRWRVVELPPRLVAYGMRWVVERLAELEGYYERGEWPLVESEFVTADVPSWLDESEAAE